MSQERADTDSAVSRGSGSSPYATGGGGVSFEHRVGALYLASMLAGRRRPEAAELPIEKVSFQVGPEHAVDDLLITCSDGGPEVTLAVACRARPNFVQSHDPTVALVGSLLEEVRRFDSASHEVAVATSGSLPQWEQLRTVCAIARAQADHRTFRASIDVDGRWAEPVRSRLAQFDSIVAKAVGGAPSEEEVNELSWRLLSRLHILCLRVQEPDESDRTEAASALDDVTESAVDGTVLRDRLETEATKYAALGAVVDIRVLRRDVHTLLSAPSTRRHRAWEVLSQHRHDAVAAVRTGIGTSASREALEIPFTDRREDLAEAIRIAGSNVTALVVSGESGTGKSALTLSTIAELESLDPGGFEAVVVNLRALPRTSMELTASIGAPIVDVLSDLSAPCRLLVIDAADATLERSDELLAELIQAASSAQVGLVVVTADTAADLVRDDVERGYASSSATFAMRLLDDDDLAKVASQFPLLRGLLSDVPAQSLLRRLVVLDLLARTGVKLSGTMGEWECLELVWREIVRADNRPNAGSPEGREQTVLAVAAASLGLPSTQWAAGALDGSAVDALRREHLLAEPSLYRSQPEFAHDEVRRYAIAVLLVKSGDPIERLESAGVPRWALSAATLACTGLLRDPGPQGPSAFSGVVERFSALAERYGPRWADVPVEAVLALPQEDAYVRLSSASNQLDGPLKLSDVVRVVQQRHRVEAGLVDPTAALPVVRVLLDEPEPWAVSDESFELLKSWLHCYVLAYVPSGVTHRVELRSKLIAYWQSFPERDSSDIASPDLGARRRRRRRMLDYHLTGEAFVETMALLGADIDDDIEAFLRAIADDAPAFLAPAADTPLSARAIAQRDPELLASLMEAYYIDEDFSHSIMQEGIRDHDVRWRGIGGPHADYYYGGFWALFGTAPFELSVGVLNRILNHAARARTRNLSTLDLELSEGEAPEIAADGVTLDLDGTPRAYVGDSAVWCWYRGTSVGPGPCTSALLAAERVAEGWLDTVSPNRVVEVLLAGCENLAIPGMLFGLLVRHIEKGGKELDRFLAEPFVWELEFQRHALEWSGLKAQTDGLANLERRDWSPREVSMTLVAYGDEQRRNELKDVATRLVETGDRLGFAKEHSRNWAACLDADNYQYTQHPQGVQIEVIPPPDVQAAQEKFEAYQGLIGEVLRLENRYWGAPKHNDEYEPPTNAEIASDLATARSLSLAEGSFGSRSPWNAIAHVARTAIQRAASGEMDALGDEGEFAAGVVLEITQSFRGVEDQRFEGQYFDLGADRAAALAFPACLTPTIAPLTGASAATLSEAGLGMAGRASMETRLYLARGCDVIWATPCAGEPCMHDIAMDWLFETARAAEIGPWSMEKQRRDYVSIVGDVLSRLRELDSESISVTALDPAIRGLGSAATVAHCRTEIAITKLSELLEVQRRAMIVHEQKGWSVDHQRQQSLVAARALLSRISSNGDLGPALEHLDALRQSTYLMTNFLHGLAAAGAENERLASAARTLWPPLIAHALHYAEETPNPYRDHQRWGDWAAAALLPEPTAWTQVLHAELSGPAIDWVVAEDIADLVDSWTPIGQGQRACVDALIRLVRRLSVQDQATRGLQWMTALCMRDGRAVVSQAFTSDDWIKEIRSASDEFGTYAEWQLLVDAMVVAGNETLAPFSR